LRPGDRRHPRRRLLARWRALLLLARRRSLLRTRELLRRLRWLLRALELLRRLRRATTRRRLLLLLRRRGRLDRTLEAGVGPPAV
jgi:hypothetical protein